MKIWIVIWDLTLLHLLYAIDVCDGFAINVYQSEQLEKKERKRGRKRKREKDRKPGKQSTETNYLQ